jgi:hypothetical protein
MPDKGDSPQSALGVVTIGRFERPSLPLHKPIIPEAVRPRFPLSAVSCRSPSAAGPSKSYGHVPPRPRSAGHARSSSLPSPHGVGVGVGVGAPSLYGTTSIEATLRSMVRAPKEDILRAVRLVRPQAMECVKMLI